MADDATTPGDVRPPMPARRRLDRGQMSESERDQAFTHLVTVFSVSAGMVGVCLTAIGLIQVVQTLSPVTTLCDAVLVGDSLIFLVATLLSFSAMRKRFRGRWQAFADAADLAFMLGMGLMVVASAILVWALI